MPERYLVLVDGDPVTPDWLPNPADITDVRVAIIEAEIEVARREFREPHALPWAPTPYGWVTSNGRAKVVRREVSNAA